MINCVVSLLKILGKYLSALFPTVYTRSGVFITAAFPFDPYGMRISFDAILEIFDSQSGYWGSFLYLIQYYNFVPTFTSFSSTPLYQY